MAQIVLPNTKTLRPYQLQLMSYMDKGGKRAVCVWHRRGGKDFTSIHQIAKMAHRRKGLYWHCLPTQRQGRIVVWEALTRDGERLIDQAFPAPLRLGEPNNTEMRIKLQCGSIYQVVGADNYNALMGANPIGVVFSEWSLTDPRVWDFVRPILLENGGWAIFIFTPRGYNAGFDMKQIAEKDPDWFYSLKTIEHTGILTKKDVDKEISDGMPAELAEQEFYCSFSAANVGAILGAYVEKAEQEGRITEVELYDPNGADTIVSSDIGFRDTAAFWFWQVKADGIGLVDYQEDSGLDAQDWISRIKASPWKIGNIYLPHDARAKTFQTKHSVMEQFLEAGLGVRIVPRVKKLDRINASRTVMPHCRFHKSRCERGLMALRDWSFEWDDKRKVFSQEPLHNWASHGGDGFSYGAMIVSNHAKAWATKVKEASRKDPDKVLDGANYAFTLEDLHDSRINDRVLRI